MVEKLKELPITPNVGDGLIWDGVQWIKVHPHQVSHALLYYMNLHDELVRAMEDLLHHIPIEYDHHGNPTNQELATAMSMAEAALRKARGEA